jgi:hypothetical protein
MPGKQVRVVHGSILKHQALSGELRFEPKLKR